MASAGDLSMVQENIDEFVNDENKIITCKWLSLTLNLHINTAKRALYTFVECQKKGKESSGINVTYFVAGLGKSKSGELEHKCVVVPEADVEAVKKALVAVTSCHIYSIQKAKLKDYTPLYQTDYDVIKQNLEHCSRLSSIKCDWVAQRAVRQPVTVTEKPSSIQKPEKSESPATEVSTSSSCAAKTNNKKKPEPKGRIASMFAAAATTGQKKAEPEAATSAQTKASDKKPVSANNKAKPTEKKGGVRSFFSTNGASRKTPLENGNSKQTVKSEMEEVPVKIEQVEESDEEPDRKRRKRIRTDLFDSSESEGEDEPEEELDHRTPEECRESPTLFLSENKDDGEEKDHSANTVEVDECSKPYEVLENGENTNIVSDGGERKRKRAMKTVTKQYQDDEGFLVTKKEVVWESESDNSEPEEVVVVEEEKAKPNTAVVKQNSKPSTNHKTGAKGKTASKKVASPQKGKQTSLMSFFKKK